MLQISPDAEEGVFDVGAKALVVIVAGTGRFGGAGCRGRSEVSHGVIEGVDHHVAFLLSAFDQTDFPAERFVHAGLLEQDGHGIVGNVMLGGITLSRAERRAFAGDAGGIEGQRGRIGCSAVGGIGLGDLIVFNQNRAPVTERCLSLATLTRSDPCIRAKEASSLFGTTSVKRSNIIAVFGLTTSLSPQTC